MIQNRTKFPSGILLPLFLFLLTSGTISAGIDDEIGIETSHAGYDNTYHSFIPVRIIIKNKGKPAIVTLTVSDQGSYNKFTTYSTKTVSIAPGENFVEMYILNHNNWNNRLKVEFTVNGSFRKKLTEHVSFYSPNRNDTIGILTYGSYKKLHFPLEKKFKKSASSGSTSSGNSPDFQVKNISSSFDASASWHNFVGLYGFIALTADSSPTLNSAMRTAISQYIRFGEGKLLVVGDNPGRFLEKLDLNVNKPQTYGKKYCGTGIIYTCKDIEQLPEKKHIIKKIFELSSQSKNMLANPGFRHEQYYYNGSEATRFDFLLNGLYEVPIAGYIILSIAFALLIGPVNYLILKKNKKLIFFFVTAPALALTGMLILTVYSVLSDGTDIKVKQTCLLLQDLDTGEGAVYQARAFYTPLSAENQQYPAETVALPFTPLARNSSRELSVDLTSGNLLRGGYIISRRPSGLFTATPKRIRMGLKVKRTGPNTIAVKNELPYKVIKGCVSIKEKGKKNLYSFKEIKAGEEITVSNWKSYSSTSNMAYHLKIYQESIIGKGKIIVNKKPLLDANLLIAAEVEGLPYLEKGSIENPEILEEMHTFIAFSRKIPESKEFGKE